MSQIQAQSKNPSKIFCGNTYFYRVAFAVACVLSLLMPCRGLAQSPNPSSSSQSSVPPKTWIDADTGHRVTRLTDEPNSQALYFNMNPYTPDGLDMIYVSPKGIHDLRLSSLATSLVVPGKITELVVGTKTRRVFFTKFGDSNLYVVSIDTKQVAIVAKLPLRAVISSVNADETLIAGTLLEGSVPDFTTYRINALAEARKELYDSHEKAKANPSYKAISEVDAKANSKAMEARLAAQSAEDIFTVSLQTGEYAAILKGTDWLNHVQFSPSDPTLILYAHEGPSSKVDRVWTIRTDGSQNQLLHKRTDPGETASHEFWSPDGSTIWYDLQKPNGQNFFLAGYDVRTGERKLFHLNKIESSLHFSPSSDGRMFCGDGRNTVNANGANASSGQTPWSREWIELLRPVTKDSTAAADPANARWFHFNNIPPDATGSLTGWFTSERLVNMSKNNYREVEPNARFSPDNKLVIFNSNMFGKPYIFAVEVNIN